MTSNVSKCINEYFGKAKQEGKAEGKAEGVSEIILNMLGQGLDEETISKYTQIDLETVKEIIKKILINNH